MGLFNELDETEIELKSERKRLTSREEIDKALKELGRSVRDSFDASFSAMCYSRKAPTPLEREVECEGCRKKFKMTVSASLCEPCFDLETFKRVRELDEVQYILHKQYKELAKKYTENGFNASFIVICQRCMFGDATPENQLLGVFEFRLEGEPAPITCYPSLTKDETSDYETLLRFLCNGCSFDKMPTEYYEYEIIRKMLKEYF